MQRADLVPAMSVPDLVSAVFVGDPTVCEAYSAFDATTKAFKGANDLLSHLSDQRATGVNHFLFTIYHPTFGGKAQTKRIALQPEKCRGATWREQTVGWGLINLQISYVSEAETKCSVSLNSAKRALTWAATYPELGDPMLWDWKAVESHGRRIIRSLRRMTVA